MPATTLRAAPQSGEYEPVIRQFEEDWRGPDAPDIERYVPAPQAEHADLLFELIHIDMDFRLRRGEAASAEAYLDRFPHLRRHHAKVLELIADEFALHRRWRGEVSTAEYLNRYPHLAHELRSRLAADTPTSGDPPGPYIPAARPHLPGYEILGELGRGGMGVVYKARQLAAGREVAVKTLLPGYAATGLFDRFRREAESIARLDHPNVVPIYEVGESGGLPYFSMKLYPGGSLSDRISGPAADVAAAAELLETVARGVHHAHQRGVLHRDLKPSNILIDEANRPHIADFGLAKQFDPAAAATLTTAVVGTPSYIAPEQARGDRGVTTATDVYGLGTVLYELLTGAPPFVAETALATLAEVVERPPVRPRSFNPAVPADLETVCLKCLEKEPKQRYASADALADDLRRWRTGEPITARPVGTAEAVWRWGRRKPREAAIVALVFTLLVATVGGVWWLDRRETYQRLEREARRQQAEVRVRGAVAQLPTLRGRFLWADGRAVLARARQEVDEFALDDLRAEVDQAERELTLAERLDDVLLDRVTAADELGSGKAEACRAYREAMREYGLDLEHEDEGELVRRVKASSSRDQLVSAIFLCASEKKADAGKLLGVGKAAQPDEWTAVLRGIPPGLPMPELQERVRERLAEVDPARMSPWLLAHVGRLAGDKVGVDLLRQAQRRAPSDFWINLTLGNALARLGRPAEAISFLRVAQSVRPDRGVVHHNLGHCLSTAGRPDEALLCHREAVRLDPHKVKFRRALEAAEKKAGEKK